MEKILKKLVVPNVVLIGIGASLWGFAAYRILMLGTMAIAHHPVHQWLNYLIGVAGFVPFFWFVFRKVCKRYITRILALSREQSHILAFMDRRGYLLMSLMIGMGIGIKHISAIPELYKGTFFISLGLSLLTSALVYVIRGVQYLITR